MDPTTINTSTLTLKNTNTSVPIAGTVTYNTGTRVATFTPSAPLVNGTSYTVTVTTGARDLAGNQLASQFTSSFTTIPAPPIVTGTFPNAFDTDIAVDTAVTVTFSQAMDPTTINSTTFSLKTTSGGIPVAGTVTYNAATFTAKFKPNARLANNTVYTATVTTGVKDTFGQPLASDKVFSFTTTKFPTVVATSPADNATGVPVTAFVTATFSEAMDATTITTSTFTLKTTAGGIAVAGTVSYDAPSNTAKFTPSAPLAPSTNYTATITTGVKDSSGNAMQANKVFTFKTAP